MTDNEIIKALDGADGLGHISIYCADNNGKDVCSIKLVDIIDLINRQKAEIERLQKENEILSTNADNAFQEGLNENRALFKQEVEAEIRAEAVKEFVERLKERTVLRCFDPILGTKIAFSEDDLNNLVKEMAGVEDAG